MRKKILWHYLTFLHDKSQGTVGMEKKFNITKAVYDKPIANDILKREN